MKVQLAYEYEGHEPDEVVDVDDATGSRLVHEGKARVPDEAPKSKSKSSDT
jgi:hypothetical protein